MQQSAYAIDAARVPLEPRAADFGLKWVDDPGHHICGPDGCRVRPRALGACHLPGAAGRRRDRHRCRRQRREPGSRNGGGLRRGRTAGRRLEPLRRPRAGAGRAAHPSRAALDRGQGQGGGCRDHRRHRALLPPAGQGCPEAPFVAVTGTNGKSTTTALIAHILRSAGLDVQMGGNIGTAILDLEPPAPERIHVIEMSSFQIELTPSLEPSIGVLLNVSPDHLDRHGTMEHYAALKSRLVEAAGHVVIGEDDDWCRDIAERLRLAERGWVDLVSARSRVSHGWYADGTKLIARAPWTGPLQAFADLAGISSLRGRHNIQNALAASAAALILGVPPTDVAAALRTFPGLPHRLEEIGRLGSMLLINDSKATNADSTATALAAFARDIFWILGGKPKEGGIASAHILFSAHRQGLPDRRGDRGVRSNARRQGRLRALRHARCRRGSCHARCGGERCPGGCGAPLSRLRLLRPVPQLRGARRRLPHAGRGPARHRAARGWAMRAIPALSPSPRLLRGKAICAGDAP